MGPLEAVAGYLAVVAISQRIGERLELFGRDRGSGYPDVCVGCGAIDDLPVGAGVVEQEVDHLPTDDAVAQPGAVRSGAEVGQRDQADHR